jgi:hypothetical protein
VQQCWFAGAPFQQQQQQQQQEGEAGDASIISEQMQLAQQPGIAAVQQGGGGDVTEAVLHWIPRAGDMLCKPQLPAVQLAVVVAFLRAVVDAVAPAVAAAEPASSSSSSSSLMLQALGRLLSSVHSSGAERLHSLLLYLLKCMKGDRPFSQLQQACQSIAQQPDHPLQQRMSGLVASPAADVDGGHSQQQQQMRQLPPDPFTQLPQYQQVLQLLAQPAAFPVSAAAVLKSKLQEAATCGTAARAVVVAVTRQLYLPRGVQSSLQQQQQPTTGQAGNGLDTVSTVLVQLLQQQPGQALVKQLILSMLTNRWNPHGDGASSSSSSSSSRAELAAAGGSTLLQLQPDASQQQLYVCSIAMHLALGLLSAGSSTDDAAVTTLDFKGSSSSSGLVAPLLLYMTDPAAAQQQYILGLPGDEATQLLNIAGSSGATTAYRCKCGMPYLIGECGKPAQELRCPSPNCPHQLGGTSHTPAAGQTQVGAAGQVPLQQKHGFISTLVPGIATSQPGSSSSRGRPAVSSDAPSLVAAASEGVRSLAPSSYQLLRLLVHAALLVGSAARLQPVGALSQLLGAASDAAAQQLVEGILLQQWQLLRRSCHATDEQLLAVVHCALDALFSQPPSSSSSSSRVFDLSRSADRVAWEAQFQQEVARPCTHNPAKALQQLLAAHQSATGAAGTAAAGAHLYIECAVQEVLDISVDPAYRTQHLPTLFRSIAVPSLDALAAQFWSDGSNAQRYPVTLAVLQKLQQQRLQLLPHLHTLVSFDRALRQRCSRTLSRAAAAATVPLVELLEQLAAQDTSSSSSAAKSPLAGSTSSAGSSTLSVQQGMHFMQAWNAVAQITTRHECRDVVVPALDASSAPAAVACLIPRDQGRLLAAMIAELAQRQNAFLTAALQRQQQQQDADSQQPQVEEASRDSKVVTQMLQMAQQPHIVDVPAALQELQQQLTSPGSSIACAGLEYGAGHTLSYDLAAVEQLLHSSLVTGKCLLDASTAGLQEFVFQGEACLAEFTLLHEVEQKVPQRDITAEQAADAAAALLQQLPTGSSPASLLPHLEVLLSFVRKTGGSPTSSVAAYVAAWVPDSSCRQLLLACQVLGQLQLQQLVAV